MNSSSFTYEDVSIEDSNAFNLEETFKKYKGRAYHPTKRKWTVDKENGVYLITISSGREVFADESSMLLFIDGVEVLVWLKVSVSYGIDEKEKITWSLLRSFPNESVSISEERIKNVLREALFAFGIGNSVKRDLQEIEFNF